MDELFEVLELTEELGLEGGIMGLLAVGGLVALVGGGGLFVATDLPMIVTGGIGAAGAGGLVLALVLLLVLGD